MVVTPSFDMQFTSEHIESLFIEVDKSVFQSKCNVIVVSLYKPPSLSIDIFNKQLEHVLDIIYIKCPLHW